MGRSILTGSGFGLLGTGKDRSFVITRKKNARELLLENVSAAYLVGYTWYRDTEYFYVYSRNVLAVLRSDGGEAYTLGLEGTIVDVV